MIPPIPFPLNPQARPAANAPFFSPILQKSHKIRITLSSRKVQVLEKVCTEIIERAKNKDLRFKGPVRLPTRNLKITTRKTPCGEGSKTWDSYEMRIHKRLIEYVKLLLPRR
jgi:small subunit ribosomal protein S20e